MDIRIAGKNISVTEGMREHLREKLGKLEKYAPRLIESHVVLKKEKYFYVAEVTLLARNLRAYGEGKAKDNIFAAMDQACVRVEKQLKRFREKVKDHRKNDALASRTGKVLDAFEDAADTVEEKSPRIVKTRSFTAIEPLFPEDASLQLRESGKPFLVFQNASTQKVNVIFRRDDGAHGLVEPQF